MEEIVDFGHKSTRSFDVKAHGYKESEWKCGKPVCHNGYHEVIGNFVYSRDFSREKYYPGDKDTHTCVVCTKVRK